MTAPVPRCVSNACDSGRKPCPTPALCTFDPDLRPILRLIVAPLAVVGVLAIASWLWRSWPWC